MNSVLIVEDDKAVREALRFSLEVEGFTVRVYESAKVLLKDGEFPSSGCLVVDQLMPEMTGLELIEALRERKIFVPTILITTRADHALRRRAARVGCCEVLEKPLEGGSLLDCIRQAIGHPETLRKL